MNFVKLDEFTVLNLDSVASVSWTSDENGLVALVRHLVPGQLDGEHGSTLGYQKISGQAALALREVLGGASITSQSKTPRLPRSNRRSRAVIASSTEPFHAIIPGLSQKKGWYYASVKGRGFFIATVNMKGSCSMRTFDAETGRFLGKQYAGGNYQDQFRAQLKGSKELTINRQPNLESACRETLPASVLEHLKSQIS